MAMSSASFLSGVAFAFVGLTFPLAGMPAGARGFSALLPLTHYLQLFVQQAVRAAPAAVSGPKLAALAVFVLCGLAAMPLLGRRMKNPAVWGLK
jgi:ABC-2 type transport system permease protein